MSRKSTALSLFVLTAALLAGWGASRSPAAKNGGKMTGAIFTTDALGSIVNANLYASKCDVYLDGGPGPNAPPKAAGLPDGDYYFQVTDPSGSVLLSSDPVANRRIRVAGGFIVAYVGDGSGPAHPVGVDLDHGDKGAITVGLANLTCAADFLDSPNEGGVYKVWATPVGELVGDPSQVAPACGGGCSFGFVASKSKTDNFKVQPSTATFCLRVAKEFSDFGPAGPYLARDGWRIDVEDPNNVVTSRLTSDDTGPVIGQIELCGLVAGPYTVREEQQGPDQVSGLVVNGVELPPQRVYSFDWQPGDPDVEITFRNYGFGIIGRLDPATQAGGPLIGD